MGINDELQYIFKIFFRFAGITKPFSEQMEYIVILKLNKISI